MTPGCNHLCNHFGFLFWIATWNTSIKRFFVIRLYLKYIIIIIIIISFPTCKFNDQSLIVLNMHIKYTYYFIYIQSFYILFVIFSLVFLCHLWNNKNKNKIEMFFLYSLYICMCVYICIYIYIISLPDYHVLYINCNIFYNLVLFFFEDSL